VGCGAREWGKERGKRRLMKFLNVDGNRATLDAGDGEKLDDKASICRYIFGMYNTRKWISKYGLF